MGAGTLIPSSLAAASEPPTAKASQAPAAAPTPAPEPPVSPPSPLSPGTNETEEAPADEAPHVRELLTSPEAGTDTEGEDVSGEADEPAPAPMPFGQAPAEPAPTEPTPVPLGQPPAPPPPVVPSPVPPQPRSAPSPQPPSEPVAPSPAAELEEGPAAQPAEPGIKRPARGRRAKPRRPAAQPVVHWEAVPERENAPTPVGATVPAATAKAALVSQPPEPVSDPITGAAYTVRPGDSLWSIARRLVGPRASAARIARELDRLWELNRDRIGTGDPSLIYAGTVLRIQ
jgi:LysM repeat protein